MSDFTDADVGNGVKGAFHGGAVMLCLVMGAYNWIAWVKRRKPDGKRDPHLALNGVVYTVGFAFEIYQVGRHYR